MDGQRKINGVVFSDLGQGSSFMALDWVQQALKKSLGFAPFPATLNVRPKKTEDLHAWAALRRNTQGISLPGANAGFCSARLFPVDIHYSDSERDATAKGAILLPEVSGYPEDKIEIVAAVRLKDELDLKDGDPLTLELLD